MAMTELKGITRAVIRRARRQGSVSPGDVRAELKQAGLSRTLWKDVVSQARAELSYRDGLYHYAAPDPGVQEEHRRRREVRRAVRDLIRRHKRSADQGERRREGRADLIQPVAVRMEDGRSFTLLSRDISPTGIRLISSRGFLGQKVCVTVTTNDGKGPVRFWVRILWTCTVGDQLFENGGAFLELAAEVTEAGSNGVLVG